MAYIVLALGAFLSIGGALSIFHGAGIVEIERGWTGVIAGATALTGGIVTIALGLILKTLLDLRPILAARPAVQALPADVRVAHDFDSHGSQEPSLAALPAEPTSLMTAELESDMLAAILAPAESAGEADRPFGAPAERPKARSLPIADVFEASRSKREVTKDEAARNDGDRERDPVEAQPDPEPAAEKSRFKISFKRQPPASLPPEPVPVAAAEPEAPAMDDWLDRAFSALDNEPSHGSPAAQGHAPEEASVPIETLMHAEPAAAEAPTEALHEPHAPEPVRQEPTPPPPAASAVIGRYAADGTSYVMYADGSIEAQSDAGVYRFNSMTELKAFIESAEA